jgi:toxin FitB
MLLDTCVVSELRRPDGSHAVKAFVTALPTEKMLLSVITISEITKGVAVLPDGEKKYRLAAWLQTLSSQFAHRILPLDQETAEIWGELSAAGQKKGITIPTADGLIAATALRHDLQIATRDTVHFEAAGAAVINPWADTAVVNPRFDRQELPAHSRKRDEP